MDISTIKKLTGMIKEELEKELGLFVITKEGTLQTKDAEYEVFFDEEEKIILNQI